ncbi:MAG: MarR family transcriptional regulator [Actinobacteria bacterium]|nr:MarR family transcriptional regulator [Actinomycetota bacterium]
MESAEWLTVDQQQAWRALIEFCGRLVDGMDADVSRFGLTSPDYEVLVHLSESQDEGLRMSELASRVLVSKSRLTYRVDRLEARGLVVREPCETDRRGFIARLTPAGFDMLAQAAPYHVQGVRDRIIEHLDDDEFLELGRLARKVLDGQRAAANDDVRIINV